MLTITSSQNSAIEAGVAAQWRQHCAAQLRQRFPQRSADAAALQAWIEQAQLQATQWRITSPGGQLRYLLLAFEHGDEFYREPWARPLHSAEPDESLRLDATEALVARRAKP